MTLPSTLPAWLVRYYLDEATTEHLGQIRTATDCDLHRAVAELVAFGALTEDSETLRPTHTIMITTSYVDGCAWSRAPTSIRQASTPPTPTGASPQ